MQTDAPKVAERHDVVDDVEQHAEVSSRAAANCPEEIGIHLTRRRDDAQVREHHPHLLDCVEIEPEHAAGESVSAALHVAGNADGIAFAARDVKPVRLERLIELSERRSCLHRRRHRGRIHRNAVEQTDIDDDSAADAVARGAVAARANGERQRLFTTEEQCEDDVELDLAVDDCERLREVRVERVSAASRFVPSVARNEDLSEETRLQLVPSGGVRRLRTAG